MFRSLSMGLNCGCEGDSIIIITLLYREGARTRRQSLRPGALAVKLTHGLVVPTHVRRQITTVFFR